MVYLSRLQTWGWGLRHESYMHGHGEAQLCCPRIKALGKGMLVVMKTSLTPPTDQDSSERNTRQF